MLHGGLEFEEHIFKAEKILEIISKIFNLSIVLWRKLEELNDKYEVNNWLWHFGLTAKCSGFHFADWEFQLV